MRALILEHAEHEGAGLLAEALVAAAVALDYRRLWRGDALPGDDDDDAHALVVAMGGPMSAWDDALHPWLALEAALLARRARAGRLTLGVCLGAQLLARGLGARVYRGSAPEFGLWPIALDDAGRTDPLLATIGDGPVVQWHFDTFDLPPGAVRLASSPVCAQQAFRVQRAWAVQFHVECTAAMRRDWATRGADELAAAGVAPSAFDADERFDERGRAFARALCALLPAVAVGTDIG